MDEEHGAQSYPEPTRTHRLVVATFALMLATAGIAFAVGTFRPDTTPVADETPSPSGQPSPIPSLTGEPRITANIPFADPEVDDPIGGVAVGAGSAWVGLSRRGTSGAVARIDLETNQVLTEVPVRETPYRKGISATDHAVWVASTGVLERIDPATNAVVASVDLQGRSVSAIAADATAVWAVAVTEPTDQGGQWTGKPRTCRSSEERGGGRDPARPPSVRLRGRGRAGSGARCGCWAFDGSSRKTRSTGAT